MFIAISVLLILTATGLIYYWADFYLTENVQVIDKDWYVKFQKAFTIADLWTAIAALTGAVGLIIHQEFGLLFSLVTAASLIFLGLMDVTFNVQNKLYKLIQTSSQMKFEVFINVWTLGFGIALLIFLWPRLGLV